MHRNFSCRVNIDVCMVTHRMWVGPVCRQLTSCSFTKIHSKFVSLQWKSKLKMHCVKLEMFTTDHVAHRI